MISQLPVLAPELAAAQLLTKEAWESKPKGQLGKNKKYLPDTTLVTEPVTEGCFPCLPISHIAAVTGKLCRLLSRKNDKFFFLFRINGPPYIDRDTNVLVEIDVVAAIGKRPLLRVKFEWQAQMFTSLKRP